MGEENENKILNLLKSLTMEKRDRQNDGENPREHKFWSTQPVVQHEENVENDGEIQLCDTEKLNPNPAPLPAGFEWFIVDIDNADEVLYYNKVTGNVSVTSRQLCRRLGGFIPI